MAKIRIKRRRLNEDDQQPMQQPMQQPQQNNQQQQTQQQPQQNNQQQQNQNQDTVQQQTQQTNQQQQQNIQQVTQPNKYEQKIQEVLKKMENTYWMIAVNVPEEIQKDIPDFRQGNQMADPIIKIWNDFKANPNQENFNAFIDAFKTFGTVSLNTSTNVNAGLKAAYSFNKKLMDNLNLANQRKYYNSVIEDYFDKTEFTL